MADSYIINDSDDNRIFNTEILTQVQPYWEQGASLAIMNNKGSDSIIRIKSIEVNELETRNGSLVSNLELRRITALGVGIEALISTKMDSGNASLPSQVGIYSYPPSYTGTEVLRKYTGSFSNIPATALASRSSFSGGNKVRFDCVFNNHFPADLQSITLREGQGIALINNSTSLPSLAFELTVYFNVGTETHIISKVLSTQKTTALFGLLNGTGSGVVIDVHRIMIKAVHTTELVRMFNIEMISGAYDGEVVTATKLDSSSPAIPSGVLLRKNCVILQANKDANFGGRARVGGDITPLRRMVRVPFGLSPALANGLLALHSKRMSSLKANVDQGDIVLREGDGVAIVQRVNPSSIGRYEFNVLFNYESTAATGGGGEYSTVF